MALTPTYWREHKVDGYTVPDVFTEGNGWMSVREGFYKDPSMSEQQLIERHLVLRNQFDHVMYAEHEVWDYRRPRVPPERYTKYVEAKVFLPVVNVGRTLMEVEREVTAFWTFCPWAKDVLAFRREVSGFVVLDLKPLSDLDVEAILVAEGKGYNASDTTEAERRMVIDTQRWWREAIRDRSFSESADANQTTRWVEAAIVEETEITEEMDRFTKWIHRKNRIRPDDNRVVGPEYFKKESHTYESDVPVAAPRVAASDAADNGIRVEVRGGGADVEIALPSGVNRSYNRGPDQYRIYRKKISEADRAAGKDPYKIFKDDASAPEPRSRRQVIESTFIGGYDGVPDTSDAPGLPSQTSYTEPHDPEPVDPDSWRHVADVDNQADNPDHEEGFCTIYDPDVRDAGEYAYVAVATVQDSDSRLSNEDQVTRSGDGPHSSSLSIRERENGDLEGDFEMPNDPSDYTEGAADFGEVIGFTVPALVHRGDWPEPAQEQLTVTSSHTADNEEETFDHTPRENPDEWQPGRRCRVVDRVGPGQLHSFANHLSPWQITGRIKEVTDTTTTLEALDSDGHEYPEGAALELLPNSMYDPRTSKESGEEENGTMEALVLAIGTRQGLRYRRDSFKITVDIPAPILGLRNGQTIFLEDLNWDAFGNDLWLKSQVEQVPWRLRGFKIRVNRSQRDNTVTARTVLTLEER